MAAGDSARESADDYEKEGRRLLALSRQHAVGAEGEGLVAAALQPLTGLGWTLLEDRRWSPGSDANIDLIAVGPGGVVVVDAKNWHTAPKVANDALLSGNVDCSDQVETALAAARRVEESVGALRIAPAAVSVMMAFARHKVQAQVGRVTVVGAHGAAAHIAGLPIRFTPAHTRRAVAHLDIAFPAHTTPPVAGATKRPSDPAEPLTLFDVHEMLAAQARSARLGPIEEWMTWISPDQHDLVRRNFGGPARISGVAGTGKSVVGLHRAAYLAGQGQGPVLFVTFVKNLVGLQRSLLTRLAPTLRRRVEFRTVHGLATWLLSRHGPVSRIKPEELDRCFDDAWRTVGRPLLSPLDRRQGYWRDEILYVIKGRGFTTLDQYIGTERHGRRMPLQDRHREAVWQLHTEYERLRRERGLYDFADMLLRALGSVRREPIGVEYAAVIVDEAQDLTLTGLRLVHALVGDKPNGLLLIGDAQQAVYPGGYRLADAGIQIRGGRSVILRVNYRNRSAILAAAAEMVSEGTVTDIDGGPVAGNDDVETTREDGEVTRLTLASEDALDRALVAGLKALDEPAAAAVLCPDNASVNHYTRILHDGELPTINLEHYNGTTPAIKIGTFAKSKGIEFKHVFLPDYDRARRRATTGGLADADRLQQANNELYVAMVRARDTLWLGALARRAT